MAEHANPEYGTAPGNDYAEHQRTYRAVMHLTKVSVAAIVAILIALTIFYVAGLKWVGLLGFVLTLGATGISLGSREGGVGMIGGVVVLMLVLWAIAR